MTTRLHLVLNVGSVDAAYPAKPYREAKLTITTDRGTGVPQGLVKVAQDGATKMLNEMLRSR